MTLPGKIIEVLKSKREKKTQKKEDSIQIVENRGPKYGRQLKRRHESQLKGPPKNAITEQAKSAADRDIKTSVGTFSVL